MYKKKGNFKAQVCKMVFFVLSVKNLCFKHAIRKYEREFYVNFIR